MEQPEVPISTEALFQEHAYFVARFLARLGADPQDIADLVQEVFLVVHAHGGYRPGPARPTTWLGTIAVRVAQGARKARRRGGVTGSETVIASAVSDDATPLEAAVAVQDLRRLAAALDVLDFAHRAVFVMYELEGEPREAIAQALDIPVGTVDSRLHTARRKVKEAFERAETTPHAPRPLSALERRAG
ncbi:RNA polymerase sigma factor [Sorangium sp. So ce296]|uniref:RNA polymerase sigma factor n=1 Tax=Sorangium sp. So ce296 TaxID=3133296 RepID=UPI003F62C5AA